MFGMLDVLLIVFDICYCQITLVYVHDTHFNDNEPLTIIAVGHSRLLLTSDRLDAH